MNDIPPSRQRICSYCAMKVDSAAAGTFQLARGWLENRRKGGANTIAIPKRFDAYACNECVDKLRHGIPVGQQSLFNIDAYDNA